MSRLVSATAFLLVITALLSVEGCSYFNTYYNIKKKFREAEKDYNRQQTSQTPATQGGAKGEAQPGMPQRPQMPPPSQPGPAQGVPIDKYRKVIETAAKLLDYYPKSRWIDDTLLLMGISYFRLQDYSRAERKFTELMTIFPKSEHVPAAAVWKARTLVSESRHEDAILLLTEVQSSIKDRRMRGEVESLLASIEFEQKHWDDAAEHFKAAAGLLPSSESKYDALFHYGLSALELKQYNDALKAFIEVARYSRDSHRAFDANIYASRAALGAGDPTQAEAILSKLKKGSIFVERLGDVDLELANLAAQSGRTDEAIELYQKYLQEHPTGEKRGLAFYRLAGVYRSSRVDLQQASAMLDSAMRETGNPEISDSARAVHTEISQGLQVLVQFKSLQDTIAHLEQQRAALPQGGEAAPVPPPPDTTSRKPQAVTDSVRADTSQPVAPPVQEHAPTDTTNEKGASNGPGTPDSARAAAPVDTGKTAGKKPAAIDTAKVSPGATLDNALKAARSQYQLAALRVAEFYQFTLNDPDSALTYYTLAAGSKDNPAVYWRANLFLAERAARDSANAAEARQYFQAVADADSVPLAARNAARQALGLLPMEEALPPQQAAFRAAEQANNDSSVPPDSVVRLYGQAVAMDSTSALGMKALFAQLYLYDSVLGNADSSKAVAQRLMALFPDSTFNEKLRTRIMPPDSNSVFLMSDEQLYPHQASQGSVIEETPTQGGWPPAEESLRGRRYD